MKATTPALCVWLMLSAFFSCQPWVGKAAGTQRLDSGPPAIDWQGYNIWEDPNAPNCGTMQAWADAEEMKLSYCGQPSITQGTDTDLKEMLARFAPFEYRTTRDRLVFRGPGRIAASPAWQRAILGAIRSRYLEIMTGHICSACHTILSWFIREPPAAPTLCGHLFVSEVGYASVETMSCDSRPVLDSLGTSVVSRTEGWLETLEWEQFDDWLYNRSAVYVGNSYFDGKGSQTMREAEVRQLEALVHSVYARLAQ